MKKLIIVGSSWACGEWINSKANELTVSHPGLGEYLSSEYDVVNLSRGGASNWQTCFALRNYLTHVKNHNISQILIVQTDAVVDHSSNVYRVDWNQIYAEATDLKNLYERALEIFYINLNNVGNQFDIKINMIGGSTDIDLNLLQHYNRLVPLCESWIKLIDNQHVPSIMPLIFSPSFLESTKKFNRPDLIDQIIDHSDASFLKAQKLMETEYFGPAYGDFHPSRLGHKLLSDYIKTFFKNSQ